VCEAPGQDYPPLCQDGALQGVGDRPSGGHRLSRGIHLSQYDGLSMSGNEEAKRDAEQQVSKELANQPKQDGLGKEESKDGRADAEEKLTTPRRSE
jgi:hypothetical protein